jgi:hypothetical protein
MSFDDEDRSKNQPAPAGQTWSPRGIDLEKVRAQALARNRGKFSKGVKETSSTSALQVPVGMVRLEELTNYDWKRQLAEFIERYGRYRANNFNRMCSEDTLIDRHNILFSTVRDVMQERHLKTLSQVRPRLLPQMFVIWTNRGVKLTPFRGHFPTERKSPKCPNLNYPTPKAFGTKWLSLCAAVARPVNCPRNLAATPPVS